MPYSLKDRTVLVTGGSRGLGAVICEKFAAQGANIAINYASSEDAANKLAEKLRDQYKVTTATLKADCGSMTEVDELVKKTISLFGGIDIIIGNAGYTKFAAFNDLTTVTEEDWDKCFAVNVKGQFALLRSALPTFEQNEAGGVVIYTSSVAGASVGGSSMAYSITKAAQLHMTSCLAQTWGPKVRVNAVLPGLLLTEWGQKFPAETIKALEERAALKSVTDLGDCADIYVSIAQNTSMTGQRIAVDAGINVARMK